MYPLFDYAAGAWQGILFFAVAILLAVVVLYLVFRGSKSS